MSEATQYVICKRGLYYRPKAQGYVGIKEWAGVYSKEEAEARSSPDTGVTSMPYDEAPDISPACYDDIARDWLMSKLNEARTALSQARAEGRRDGLEAGAAAASDIAQQWDDGEGSRTFNACMAIQDKLLEMAKEGKDG